MPTFPADYKGMLISAIEDDNPVIIIEHRWTHYVKGQVDDGYYKEDITKPKRLKKGNQCTVVATSYSVLNALEWEDYDIFELRSLRPLDMTEILESLKRTRKLITIDTGYKTYGIGAEIIARCAEEGIIMEYVKRIGIPDHPIPSSRGYLPGLYPDTPPVIDSPDPSFQGPF